MVEQQPTIYSLKNLKMDIFTQVLLGLTNATISFKVSVDNSTIIFALNRKTNLEFSKEKYSFLVLAYVSSKYLYFFKLLNMWNTYDKEM